MRESRSADSAVSTAAETTALRAELGSDLGGDTVDVLRRLQADARTRPDSAQTNALLGLAYAKRARETGDAAFYARADAALRRAQELEPTNVDALTGLGGLALARHRFDEALVLGRRARAAAPSTAAPYGVVGDALLELGRYDEAFAAFDRMAALKPNASSYSRVSYARELNGRRPRGDRGDGARAGRVERHGPRRRPGAPSSSASSTGRSDARRPQRPSSSSRSPSCPATRPRSTRSPGSRSPAVARRRRSRSSAGRSPRFRSRIWSPSSATCSPHAGREGEAREQYALVRAIERLEVANGVETDLETALFRIDHGIRLRESLRLARTARAARPSTLGDDVLAWALVRNGRCAEARLASERSLRLGQREASFYFHRGMIERCLGNGAAARTWFARALELNPHFSILWAPVARKAVA